MALLRHFYADAHLRVQGIRKCPGSLDPLSRLTGVLRGGKARIQQGIIISILGEKPLDWRAASSSFCGGTRFFRARVRARAKETVLEQKLEFATGRRAAAFRGSKPRKTHLGDPLSRLIRRAERRNRSYESVTGL